MNVSAGAGWVLLISSPSKRGTYVDSTITGALVQVTTTLPSAQVYAKWSRTGDVARCNCIPDAALATSTPIIQSRSCVDTARFLHTSDRDKFQCESCSDTFLSVLPAPFIPSVENEARTSSRSAQARTLDRCIGMKCMPRRRQAYQRFGQAVSRPARGFTDITETCTRPSYTAGSRSTRHVLQGKNRTGRYHRTRPHKAYGHNCKEDSPPPLPLPMHPRKPQPSHRPARTTSTSI